MIKRMHPREGTFEDDAIVISEPTVSLGSEFKDGGRLLLRVISIDMAALLVTAECSYPVGGENMTFPLVHVVESIRIRVL
jgi:hypothetical protein